MSKPAAHNIVGDFFGELPKFVQNTIKITLVVLGIIAGIVIYKKIKDYLSRPPMVPIPNDQTSSGAPINQFDPKPITDAIHQDVYEIFGSRNNQAYNDFLNLSNSEIAVVYNDWTNRYYSADGETLTTAIAGELVPFTQQKFVLDRLKTLNLA